MSPTTSRIARVIEELELEREHMSARLAKIDAAIATMRELFHLPGDKPAAALRISKGSKARTASAPTGATRKGDQALDAIRAALKAGPLSPGELETKLKISRYMLNTHVKQLEADGVLVSTGTTISRRIALAGTPAKEAPQR